MVQCEVGISRATNVSEQIVEIVGHRVQGILAGCSIGNLIFADLTADLTLGAVFLFCADSLSRSGGDTMLVVVRLNARVVLDALIVVDQLGRDAIW
jgi:hypothetical protein